MTVGYGPLLRRDGPSPAVRSNTLIQNAAEMGLLFENDVDPSDLNGGPMFTYPQKPLEGSPISPGRPLYVPGVSPRWLNGITLQSYSAAQAEGFDPCGDGTDAIKTTGGAINLPSFGAVQIYFPETCTARVVGPPPNDPSEEDDIANDWFVKRAVAGLGGTEEAAVENVLCTGGAVPNNPHLTDTNLNVLNPVAGGSGFTETWTPWNPVQALANLEEQIGSTGKGGIIHAPPAIITYWARYRCIQEPTRKGDLYTQSGTSVVCGYGYLNAVPDGSNFANLTVNQDWVFATGPIMIWREPGITVVPGTYKEALDRDNNELTYRAERSYLVAWDGTLQAGALIDRSIPG